MLLVMPDELEERVSALETQVQELTARVNHSEQDAAAARVLVGGADRDVGEISAEIREFREQNSRTLNAMRQDHLDLVEHVDRGFAEIRGRLDGVAAGVQTIADLIGKQTD